MFVDPVLLYDYTCWANDRALQGARQLSQDRLHTPIREGWLSTLALLTHVMSAEQTWLARWKGSSPDRILGGDGITTLDALAAAWAPVRTDMRAFLASLGTGETALHYRSTRGDDYTDRQWQLVAHVINHGTEHRSQVALYLAMQGIDLGNLDLIVYLRELAGR